MQEEVIMRERSHAESHETKENYNYEDKLKSQ